MLRPACINPGDDCGMRYSSSAGAFGQSQVFSINHEMSIISLVGVLCFTVGPAAIIWTIVTGIVDPIQGLPFWLFAHIFVEIGEYLPAITNANAAPAIIFEVGVIWILATLFHGIPYPVFPALCPGGVFSSSVDGQIVIAKAPAAFGFPVHQFFYSNQLFGAALAPTRNLPVPGRLDSGATNKPSAYGGTCQLFGFGVIFARHAVPPNRYGAGSDCSGVQPAAVALLYCKCSIEAKHGP